MCVWLGRREGKKRGGMGRDRDGGEGKEEEGVGERKEGRKEIQRKKGGKGEGDRNQRVLGTSVNHRGQKCNSDCCLMNAIRV